MSHQLAQVNVALLREPLESPLLSDFVAALEPLNALADRSPGFVWRLQTEAGDATAIRAFDAETMIVNMSVWESIEALAAFVYGSLTTPPPPYRARSHRSDHVEVMRQRRKWFHHVREAYQALWWVPVGTVPTVDEAKERLAHLREVGPTPFAFTFKRPFQPPPATEPLPIAEPWYCPA